MRSQHSNIIIATIIIVLILSSIPHEATARNLKEEERIRWTRSNTHLLLPSFYNLVRSPSPNPGTEARAFSQRTAEEKNFAGRRKRVAHPPPIPPSHGY
ncbi:hypothetical protein A4A49_63073 [Nicotiana attenuata]|uniref:Uncharacterized protein n=1 Tax=Nicotiana attenuata TaxID=49451 RepID=A0A1J6IV75_NICAT|nr:hypothetical protein A4A49_63073 [Nicotiana attenuata]